MKKILLVVLFLLFVNVVYAGPWGSGGSSGVSDIVDDTTPQLGGNLDVNGFEIQSDDNLIFQLGDNAGANSLKVQDSDSSTIFEVDSDGAMDITSIDSDLLTARTVDLTADGISDDTYTGEVLFKGITGGESITQWDVVFLNDTDGEWHRADADVTNKFPARGIATSTVGDGSTLIVLQKGLIRNDGWSWTGEGSTLYLDTAVGGITETGPTTTGNCWQVIGWTVSDDEAYIDVDNNWAVVD